MEMTLEGHNLLVYTYAFLRRRHGNLTFYRKNYTNNFYIIYLFQFSKHSDFISSQFLVQFSGQIPIVSLLDCTAAFDKGVYAIFFDTLLWLGFWDAIPGSPLSSLFLLSPWWFFMTSKC